MLTSSPAFEEYQRPVHCSGRLTELGTRGTSVTEIVIWGRGCSIEVDSRIWRSWVRISPHRGLNSAEINYDTWFRTSAGRIGAVFVVCRFADERVRWNGRGRDRDRDRHRHRHNRKNPTKHFVLSDSVSSLTENKTEADRLGRRINWKIVPQGPDKQELLNVELRMDFLTLVLRKKTFYQFRTWMSFFLTQS